MGCFNRYVVVIFSVFFSIAVCAKDITVINEIKNNDGSAWVIEVFDGDYNLKYTNSKGKVYSNSKIITSDIEAGNLFLDYALGDSVSLLMSYPKDSYIFKFSSGTTPNLLSACKRITLSSADQQQAVALLTLCAKDSAKEGMTLPNADIVNLLAPDNLMLAENIKALIGNDKAFLYDSNKDLKRNKPYLIKGDVVEILEYRSSMLKIKYTSKSKTTIAWIKFIDIL